MERESLEKMTQILANTGKKDLEQRGHCMPVAYLIPASEAQDPVLVGMNFNGNSQKVQAFRRVSQMAKEMKAAAVIFVSDCWIKRMPVETPPEKLHLDKSLEFDPERTEAIMANCSTTLGENYMISLPYHREGDQIVWEEPVPGEWVGQLSSRIPQAEQAPLPQC